MRQLTAIPGVVLALVIIGTITFATYKSMMSDGKVDYCYTEARGFARVEQSLWAHRPWRQDRHLGDYGNLDAATEAAKKYGCEIK